MTVTDRTSQTRAPSPTRNANEWYVLLNSAAKKETDREFQSINSVLNGDPFLGLGQFASPPDSLLLRILGLVERPSSREAVQEAFRRRVKETHPDLGDYNPMDWGSAARWGAASTTSEFQEVVWARDVWLSKVREPRADAGPVPPSRVTDNKQFDGAKFATHNEASRIEAEYRAWRIARGYDEWLGPIPQTAEEWVEKIQPKIRRRAILTALLCGRCGRDIAPKEPVHRRRMVSCSDCVIIQRNPEPCDSCGRPTWDERSHPVVPVFDEIIGSYRRRRFCCERCQNGFYRRRRRRRIAEKRRADGSKQCQECHDTLDGQRADARYCSSACRQRAYRSRLADRQ